MKYLYLFVGAVLGGVGGCFGHLLVWWAIRDSVMAGQATSFMPLIYGLSYLVLIVPVCLLGATLFGFLGYRLGKHLHEIDSDQMSQQIKEADVP